MNTIKVLLLCILSYNVFGQIDTNHSKIAFEADFRFRLEQDWNSKKSDGSFREDRSRMRYRARVGLNYQIKQQYSFGLRIRTGNPIKQQDPQLTLGDGSDEFGTLAVGFEKAYFKYENKSYELWLGKNSFPFEKNNELFWSDNVFPEGAFLKKKFAFENSFIDNFNISAGHFIINSMGASFDKDSYFSGAQISCSLKNERIFLFPSFYLFNNISNIPDGNGTFKLNYAIIHLGTRIQVSKAPLFVEFDFYSNLEDYSSNDSISNTLSDQTSGFVSAISYGKLNTRGDWNFKLTHAYLQQFSAVDFLAQNDWARWDYSSFGSPDGRLTNLQGIEVVASYLLEKNIKLTTKFYQVEQLIKNGVEEENGSRIRFDVDIKF